MEIKSAVPIKKLEQYEQIVRVMYQRLTETSGNNCLRAFISSSTSCLIASRRRHVSVRRRYITRKVCLCCSNLLDKNSAWSPSRNSKHASLWLNKEKFVSKNSSTLGMKKFIATPCWISKHVVSRPPELFTLPGHHQAFLIYETINLTYIFYSFDEVVKARENCIPCKYKKVDIKARNLINKCVLSLKKIGNW